jgi:hypothetical protein
MTSMFGTDQGYQAIANQFLSLSLTEGDILFGTDYAPILDQKPLPGGINYANLVKTQKIIDGEEKNPAVLADYLRKVYAIQNQTSNLDTTVPKTADPSVYEILHMFPELSIFASLIDVSNLKKDLIGEDKVTLIVPTNNALMTSLNTWLRIKGYSPSNEVPSYYDPNEPVQPYKTKYVPSDLGMPDWHYIREISKAHLLRYELRPQDIYNRKLACITAHDTFSVYVDGTARIRPEMFFYQKSLSFLNYQYPIPTDPFIVKKIFEGRNGVVYVIDGVFSFTN